MIGGTPPCGAAGADRTYRSEYRDWQEEQERHQAEQGRQELDPFRQVGFCQDEAAQHSSREAVCVAGEPVLG